jgi:CheY-like chemotaxis protein
MLLNAGDASIAFPTAVSDRSVLLVDDHEPTLTKLQQLVQSAGYECFALPSASEALLFCDCCCPAVVVTDLVMPRLDGRVLARWLKARYPSLPVVLVTGEPLEEPVRAALERTFEAVMTKPLHLESFLGHLEGLMPRAPQAPHA